MVKPLLYLIHREVSMDFNAIKFYPQTYTLLYKTFARMTQVSYAVTRGPYDWQMRKLSSDKASK